MKTVILAGGLGTRISEESHLKPKPMIEIGDFPILWHIMKIYAHYGHKDFVVCCGYKQYVIKEYFANYFLHNSDVTFDFGRQNRMAVHHNDAEPWRVTVVDTGRETMTGGRLLRVRDYLEGEPFMLTYGDGVSDVDIGGLLAFHRAHGKLATVTAVKPAGKFGTLGIGEGERVTSFREKPRGDGHWINGGFFALEPGVFDYLSRGDQTVLEREPMEALAAGDELRAYRHTSFWHPMDTMRDKVELDELWASDACPWRLWA
jgi:glucose-1-phosphate cytidylyltransferase